MFKEQAQPRIESGLNLIPELDSSEKDDKYLPAEDLSNMYKYGFSADPTDKKPFELSCRCYLCGVSYSIDQQMKSFVKTGKAGPNLNS